MPDNSPLARSLAQHRLPGWGDDGEARLARSKVLIVGLGGLGCPAALYLAAAGVKGIGLIDPDVVSEHNLHRQVLFGPQDIGQPKVDVAAKKLQAQNPDLLIEALPEALTVLNGYDIVQRHDIVLDCSDNFGTRYLANDLGVLVGRPVVQGSVYQYEGQLTVLNYPMSVGPNYRCLFQKAPEDAPDCSTAGVLGPLCGQVGAAMAAEALKLITLVGQPLAGKLQVLDALSGTSRKLAYDCDSANPTFEPSFDLLAHLEDYTGLACGVQQLTAEQGREAIEKQTVALLDVRAPEERAKGHIGGAHVTLGELPDLLGKLQTEKPYLVYCARGQRSLRAASLLRAAGYDASSLAGGLEAYLEAYPDAYVDARQQPTAKAPVEK